MKSVKYSLKLATILMLGSMFSLQSYAGTTGMETQERDAEVAKVLRERECANMRWRVRMAATRAGMDMNKCHIVQNDQCEVYIYSGRTSCTLVKAYNPYADTLYCGR